MRRFLLFFAVVSFSTQFFGQSATTMIEVLDPFVMFPTLPAISGNSVVFIDYRNYKYSIFDVNISTKQERVLVPNPGYTEPQIRLSDNRMVWIGYPIITQADLYLRDISSNITTRITEDAAFQNYPDIYKNKVVWQDYRNAAANYKNADIYLFDIISGQTKQITTEPSYQTFPAIWENIIVWEDHRNAYPDTTNADIYIHNLNTNQEIQITSDPSAQLNPDIWGSKIVWEDYRNGVGDIYMFDLSTNTERAISTFNAFKTHPVIFGDWIVWQDYRNGAYADIYGFNLATNQEYPVIVQPHHQDFATIDNLNLIWQDFQNNRQDLYRAVLKSETIGSLTLTSPNGGENWQIGNTYPITWNSINVPNVQLEYTTNNGSSWIVIIPSTSSNMYNWTVPNYPSTQCRVRVTDINNPTVSDQSDGMFTISETPLVTLISPNGGENWQVGSTQLISWYYVNVNNIKIDYSTNNGTSWSAITLSIPNSGSYRWSVPNTPSTNCLVRITDVSSAVTDISNEVFTISPSPNPVLKVAAPNGGEHFEPGSTVTIKWVSQDINNVGIDYSSNNGASWNSVVQNIPAANGSYDWTTPEITSNSCLIRICDAANLNFCDQSDSTFRIAPVSVVAIVHPNGGEVLHIGSTVNILWTSSNVLDVKIELSIDNGDSWIDINSFVASSGIYPWVVTNSPSFQSLIKITDLLDYNVYDISENVFTIEEEPVLVEESFISGIPTEFKLHQNFPNPFNPTTSIYYSIPEPSFIKLEIYTLLGEKTAELVGEYKGAGNYVEIFNFENFNSGVYLCVMQAGSYIKTIKMILLK
jgi:beta propeller repeat protein